MWEGVDTQLASCREIWLRYRREVSIALNVRNETLKDREILVKWYSKHGNREKKFPGESKSLLQSKGGYILTYTGTAKP